MKKENRLNEEALSDALAMRDRVFVVSALAEMAGTSIEKITKIMEMRAPKPIVALSWKAGLSMRFALKLQQDLVHIKPGDLVYPRGGTDYPFTDQELNWQLEFLGLQ